MGASFPTRLLATIVAILGLALIGAGCGGDDDSGGPADETTASESAQEPGSDEGSESPFDRDACELLTPADVEAVLGERVEGSFSPGEGESSTPGRCEWATGQAADLTELQASGVTLFLGDEQIFENTRILAESAEDYETLDGIGDEAYAGGGEGGVRIGDAGMTVTPIGINTNDPAAKDLIVDLLRRVSANY